MNKKLEKLKERDEIDRLAYSDLDSSKRLPACPTLARHSENQKPIKVITKTVRTYNHNTLLLNIFSRFRKCPNSDQILQCQ